MEHAIALIHIMKNSASVIYCNVICKFQMTHIEHDETLNWHSMAQNET